MSHVDLQEWRDEAAIGGQRHNSKGGFLISIDTTAIAGMKNTIAKAQNPESNSYVFQLGGAITDADEGDTPYSGRSARYYWIASALWNDSADDER
jgi:hypothetical protein